MHPAHVVRAAPPDMDAIAARVRAGLRAGRWCHLEESLDAAEFHALTASLGTISRNMEILVAPDREQAQRAARRNNLPRPSIYQSTAMDFHTDPPPADLLALHCVTQDDVDGASLLVSLDGLSSAFNADELDALGRVRVAYSVLNADGLDELAEVSLVTRHPDGPLVNYMPWGVRPPDDPALALLLERFERFVRARPVVSIRLNPGESLVIDNRRALHGRGRLAPDSKRHLLRVNIKCGPDLT